MHTHARSCLAGPITGTREWWRHLEPNENTPTSNKKEPMFRAALVEHVRREIAAGTYDTPEKFEIALDRLLRRIEAEDA
ncbi:MAG TPA: hypothetical protein VE988_24120 [Gemmataceae bacterium]|nr:hypothetical protein [Gemmataceae bacterium]